MSLKEKILSIVRNIYGGSAVVYESTAEKELAKLEALGFGKLPICMAKTQYSLSDDAAKLGAPKGFHCYSQKSASQCRRRLCGSADRRYHDDAGSFQSSCLREN